MKVAAMLFNPPGMGEYLTKSFDMPDASMPTSPQEFGERSLKAMKFFWPEFHITPAIHLDVCQQRNVVEGMSWQVQWATDAYVDEMKGFIERHATRTATFDEFMAALAKVQPTRRVQL